MIMYVDVMKQMQMHTHYANCLFKQTSHVKISSDTLVWYGCTVIITGVVSDHLNFSEFITIVEWDGFRRRAKRNLYDLCLWYYTYMYNYVHTIFQHIISTANKVMVFALIECYFRKKAVYCPERR